MTEDIKGIIDGVVRERLAASRILDVQVDEGEDCDGDTVYLVTVVFDGPLDAQKTAGLARHTRTRLAESNAFKFPVFRFVSNSDAKRLRAAAA